MRVGTNLWPGYEPLYLAQELGYWEPQEIKLAEFPSSSEVIRAFRNQSLDAAALTLDEVLMLWQQNIQAEVVLVLDVSNGADVIISDAETKHFRDLKGKKVAVESGALGAYVISRALEINNMSTQDIELVPLGVSDHEAAFKNGDVQAAVTFEPVRTKLLEVGGNEVFSSREMPNEIVDVLVIRKSYIDNHPEQAETLADGWFKVIEFMKNNPQEAAVYISERLKISPEDVISSYDGLDLAGQEENESMLVGRQGTVNQTLMKLTASMMQNKLLTEPPPLERVINDSLVK